jgi:hypothetical protein
MLHVSFTKLACRGTQQMIAKQLRLGMYQRHGVLQLVTETESASGLIKSRACPHATGQRLIDKPAIRQKVYGCVRGFYMDYAQRPAPIVPDAFNCSVGALCTTKALRKASCFAYAAGGADGECDSPLLSVGQR